MWLVWLSVVALIALDAVVAWLSLGPLCFPPDDASAQEYARCAAAAATAERYQQLVPWTTFVAAVVFAYAVFATFRRGDATGDGDASSTRREAGMEGQSRPARPSVERD